MIPLPIEETKARSALSRRLVRESHELIALCFSLRKLAVISRSSEATLPDRLRMRLVRGGRLPRDSPQGVGSPWYWRDVPRLYSCE
jgi:hypothetical protein